MKLPVGSRLSRKKKTNAKNKPLIPAKKQRLRIKVTHSGRIELKVESVKPRSIDTFETEGDTDELPAKKRKSKKAKRLTERSKLLSKRTNRNNR